MTMLKVNSQKAIGIDLGTTNSVVAFARDQTVSIIANERGETLIPSVVFYSEQGAAIVGTEALKALQQQSSSGIRSVKRLMSPNVDNAMALEHQKLILSREGMPLLGLGTQKKTPIEISAALLHALKHQAEVALGGPVTAAVITVPAYFDEAARQATKDAATLAKIQVLRLLNEPTAAAVAYGLDRGIEGVYAIYDLGGGTFDISLLRLQRGVFQVLATGGHTHLGGDDIDQLILDYWQESATHQIASLQIARQAKHHLTNQLKGEWILPTARAVALDRPTFDQLATPLIDRTIEICRQVMLAADLTSEEINGVVLVGGSTRMPILRQRVEEFFGKAPLTDINPDEVVAAGAALQAEALTQGSTTLLLDVTPLSLGIETLGGTVEKIIPRNTPIPAKVTQEFTTYEDDQALMKIHVVQGEHARVDHCLSLGQFILQDIPPMTAGVARIEVTYTIDADGLLTVTALEKITQRSQSIEVKPSYGLRTEEVTKLLSQHQQEAEEI